jgi:hypothetical protein
MPPAPGVAGETAGGTTGFAAGVGVVAGGAAGAVVGAAAGGGIIICGPGTWTAPEYMVSPPQQDVVMHVSAQQLPQP